METVNLILAIVAIFLSILAIAQTSISSRTHARGLSRLLSRTAEKSLSVEKSSERINEDEYLSYHITNSGTKTICISCFVAGLIQKNQVNIALITKALISSEGLYGEYENLNEYELEPDASITVYFPKILYITAAVRIFTFSLVDSFDRMHSLDVVDFLPISGQEDITEPSHDDYINLGSLRSLIRIAEEGDISELIVEQEGLSIKVQMPKNK